MILLSYDCPEKILFSCNSGAGRSIWQIAEDHILWPTFSLIFTLYIYMEVVLTFLPS
jgi:hypothetical protein